MASLTQGMARAIPEVTVAAATGALVAAPTPGLPVIPTEVIYMQPNGLIEQIPLEHIKERDRRLVIAPDVEQVPIGYVDDLLRTVDRLLLIVRRRQTALATHGIEVHFAPSLVRGRGGADRGRGRVRQRSPPEESFEKYVTSEEEGEAVDIHSSSPSDDSDAPPS
ncbi:hypothetical protein CsSME_00003455 [Camellia sinensis var. sinensis]